MPRIDRRAVGKHHRSLHGVFELANVPRPAIFLERPHGRLRKSLGLLAELLRGNLQKVLRQQRNVLAAFSQRRKVHLNHVQPVVKVFAESALLHHVGQVAVASRRSAGYSD